MLKYRGFFQLKIISTFYKKKNNLDLKYLKNINQISDYAWIICIHDLNYYGCDDKRLKKQKKIDLKRVSLILVSLE